MKEGRERKQEVRGGRERKRGGEGGREGGRGNRERDRERGLAIAKR